MRTRSKTGSRILQFLLTALALAGLLAHGLTASAAQSADGLTLIPGGMPFGVQLQTQGVLIVGLSPVNSCPSKGKRTALSGCPAEDAGISVKDVILSIDQRQVSGANDVTKAVEESNGRELNFELSRDGKRYRTTVKPVLSEKDGKFRAGLWLRDSAAGIGTITFLCPKGHGFAGLGHGICDPGTGILMPMSRGTVMGVTIGSVRKGGQGSPGELKGYFCGGKCGALLGNTPCGAYGVLSEFPKRLADPVPVGRAEDVHTGDAYILCTLDGGSSDGVGVKKYPVRIVKVYDRKRKNKNFLIEVTDPGLIERTGGIVQGMSGSPVMQDGKLIGAITHVMVDDPSQGYGIFITNMLAQMPELLR